MLPQEQVISTPCPRAFFLPYSQLFHPPPFASLHRFSVLSPAKHSRFKVTKAYSSRRYCIGVSSVLILRFWSVPALAYSILFFGFLHTRIPHFALYILSIRLSTSWRRPGLRLDRGIDLPRLRLDLMLDHTWVQVSIQMLPPGQHRRFYI